MSPCASRRPLHTCGALVLLLAAACGGGSDPGPVASLTLDVATVSLAAVGQSQQLNATAEDENGDPIPDAPVSWETSDPEIVSVSSTGLLIGQGVGTAEVTASAGDVSATADIVVESTSSMTVFEGNGQSAAPGDPVSTPPAVEVRDGNDDPVPNVAVRFAVGGASGMVTGATPLTDASGVARVGAWRLGAEGINTLTASVDGAEIEGEPVQFIATTAVPGGYDITVRYLTELTDPQLLAFAEAELRWESILTGDLADVNATLPASSCGENPETPGPFDDLTIFVSIEPIDGPFGTLGQAGPCFVRVPPGGSGTIEGENLTVIGQMMFDSDDMELLETEGALQAVILHEMGHVLGFGTLWDTPFGLLEDPSDPDPTPPLTDTHFTGPLAIAAFDAAGGSGYTGAKVPVMNIGGAGTVNAHWRDEVFDPELMTGFLNDGFNPLSVITVRSLEDMGYTVSTAGADPFTLSPTLRIAGARRGRPMVNDIIRGPIRKMDLNGRVVGVVRP